MSRIRDFAAVGLGGLGGLALALWMRARADMPRRVLVADASSAVQLAQEEFTQAKLHADDSLHPARGEFDKAELALKRLGAVLAWYADP
jgi:hypothetical protein